MRINIKEIYREAIEVAKNDGVIDALQVIIDKYNLKTKVVSLIRDANIINKDEIKDMELLFLVRELDVIEFKNLGEDYFHNITKLREEELPHYTANEVIVEDKVYVDADTIKKIRWLLERDKPFTINWKDDNKNKGTLL